MKSNVLLAIAIITVSSLSVWAQPQRENPYSGKSPKEVKDVMSPQNFDRALKLDDKQREEIKKIRMEQMKERMHTRNLLKEKQAKLELLQTADKPDMKEINKVIDEIASIQAQQMKNQAASRQKIRSMLTEEQRIYFDTSLENKDHMKSTSLKRHQFDRGRYFRQGRSDVRPPQRVDEDKTNNE